MNRGQSHRQLKMRIALFCVFFAFATGISLSTASAHTALASSNPSDGEVVTTWPSTITMNFTEALESIKGKAINVVTVSNANGDEVDTGSVSVNGNVVTVGLKPNAVNGPVLVNYRVAASDGHVTEAEFAFTYSNGKGPDASPSPSISSTASSSSHQHGSSSHTAIYASSMILIVLTLILGFWVYRRESE